MRLLNIDTFQCEDFPGDAPKYVAGSHRWSHDEALLDDVQNLRNSEGLGFRKLKAFAQYIKDNLPGIHYLWIDTCCIDHQDAEEVSQSLESTFKWFRDAEICLAHLADVEDSLDREQFKQSVWFTRCWTLQELLAPRVVVFLSNSWEVIGNKGVSSQGHWSSCHNVTSGPGLECEISELTSIPEQILHDYEASYEVGVNVKMSWMNGRASTREEDTWYALCGILDVAIGAKYGEGHARARRRLLDAVNWRRGPNTLYSDLDVARLQIRLFEILHADSDATIVGTLFPVSIQNPTKYVALSYTWGGSVATTSITVLRSQTEGRQETSLSITPNLEAALRELFRKGIRYVWADMICINQKDFQERSNQVSLMGHIYAKATKVVAWVGLADDTSRHVMGALRSQDRSLEQDGVDGAAPPAPEALQAAFLHRPYFQRIWIIQEIAKAKSVELWCGEDVVDFEALSSLLAPKTSISSDKAYAEDPRSHLQTIQTFRTREQRSKRGIARMLLSQAFAESWASQSTDPRDKIYALLGLTLDGGDIIDYPSYTRHSDEVLKSAWINMIAVQGHTALILLARGSSDPRHGSSWTIDAHRRPPLPPWILESLRRTRETLDYNIVISQDVLAVSGCYLDQVLDESQPEDAETEATSAFTGKCQRLSMRDWAMLFEKDLPSSLLGKQLAESSSSDSNSHITESQLLALEHDAIECQLLALERGVRTAAKHSVRLVNLRCRGYRMLHQDAQHKDQIWKLENCPLPVVLRPTRLGHFRLVGEVCPMNATDDGWWKTTWEDFCIDEPGTTFLTIHIE
jgi:hypothetical protein